MYSSVEEHLKISIRNFPILVKMGYFEIEVRRRKLLSYFCEKELLLNNTIMTMPQTQESYLLSTIDTFAYVRIYRYFCGTFLCYRIDVRNIISTYYINLAVESVEVL